MPFLTDFPADLAARECEASGCNCGQDECLPARQFNREVEIHCARAAAVAKWRGLRGQTREAAIAQYHHDFSTALEGYLGVLFGGNR